MVNSPSALDAAMFFRELVFYKKRYVTELTLRQKCGFSIKRACILIYQLGDTWELFPGTPKLFPHCFP